MRSKFSKKLLILTITICIIICALMLTACTATNFKLNFEVDGTVVHTVNTNGQEVIQMPENPTKEGYTFDGWYWDKDTWQDPFTTSSLLNAKLSSDISVYAKFTETNAINGTDIKLNGYKKIQDESLGEIFYISLPNTKIIYSLSEVVEVNKNSTWSLSADISGNNVIVSNTVSLAVGDNIYYILVRDEQNIAKQYTLLIRRKPTYTVTIDYNNGEENDTFTIEENSCIENIITPLKKGYTFNGWSRDLTAPIWDNLYIEANWVANTYTITYDANGATLDTNTKTVTYDSVVTLPNLSKVGYTFNGWYDSTNTLINSGIWNYAEDKTLTANWTPIDYTITYVLNGGLATNKTTYNIETETFTLTNPTKTGYSFTGWTYDGQDSPVKEVSIEKGSTNNKAFTANWVANTYTITYDTKGGTIDTNTQTVTYDSFVSLPTPSKVGYTFNSWFLDSEKQSNEYWKYTENKTFVASWTPINYTISYVLNGGLATNKTTYNIETETFTLTNPTKTGYSFTGWTYDGQDSPVKEVSIEKGSINNKTFTANWVANTYTITYDTKGGTIDTNTQTVTYNSFVSLPTPSKVGYTFNGWFLDSEKQSNGYWEYTENKTFVANWTPIIYTITYHYNGGKETEANPKTYTIESNTITFKPAVRDGYIFKNWFFDSDLTILASSLEKNSTGNKDLYAKWSANSNTLHFIGNGNTSEVMDALVLKTDETALLPTNKFVKTGYHFAGWAKNSDATNPDYLENASYTMGPNANYYLYAIWKPNSDTKYVVNHYTQNVNDDNYTLYETTNKTGTTNSTVIPNINSYAGFTSPSTQTISINADGSTVVKYYYTRNEYSIHFITNGGTIVSDKTVKYQANINLPTTFKRNRAFSEWFLDINLTKEVPTTMPANNITVYAYWQGDSKPNDFSFEGVNEYTITAYKSSNKIAQIPEYINNIPVIGIKQSAFSNNQNLTGLFIPNSVINIEANSFESCHSLVIYCEIAKSDRPIGWAENWKHRDTTVVWETISFNSNSEYDWALLANNKAHIIKYKGNQENLVINTIDNNNVVSIGDKAFENCTSFKIVTLPNTLTLIAHQAFKGCNNLHIINIPNSVETIGRLAFNTLSMIWIYAEAKEFQPGWSRSDLDMAGNVKINYYGCTGEDITYTFDTGLGTKIEPITTKGIVSLNALSTTYNDMYIAGWYENPEYTGSPVNIMYYSTTNKTLYAKWEVYENGVSYEQAKQITEGVFTTISPVDAEYGNKNIYLKFIPTETRSYTITANGIDNVKSFLYDANKSELANSFGHSFGSNNAVITFTLNAGEIYYIQLLTTNSVDIIIN